MDWQDIKIPEGRSVFHISLIAVAIATCNACSINGVGIPGSVEETISHTDTSRVITSKAKGIHLFTRESFGIHLGYLERELVYPVIANDSLLCADRLRQTPASETTHTAPEYADQAIQVKSRHMGLGFSLSRYAINASFGMTQRKILRVAANTSFSMFYINDDKQGTQICAVQQPPLKGKSHEN